MRLLFDGKDFEPFRYGKPVLAKDFGWIVEKALSKVLIFPAAGSNQLNE